MAGNQSPGKLQNRLWIGLWVLLAILLVVRAGTRPHDRGVIIDHLEFGRRLIAAEELYAPYLEGKLLHPPYPPSFGLLTAPFSLLASVTDAPVGRRLARIAWAILQMGALFVIGWFLRDLLRRFRPELVPKAHLILFVTALVGLRYILRDTHGGGGNLINLGLLLGAVGLAQRRRSLPAGLLLGFSLATKPTGLLLLPLLWILGQRRPVAISVVATTGFMAIALVLLNRGLEPFLYWFDGTVAYAAMEDLFTTPRQGFPPFSWMNQCLRCSVVRYFGEVPFHFGEQVPHFFGGLGLGTVTTAWISRVLGLGLLGVTFGVAWRNRMSEGLRSAWLLAGVLALSLLLSPISWKAHHVALIPAFFLIVAQGFSGKRWAWWFLGLYVLLCGVGEALVGKDYKNLQQALYLTTAGTLATLGLCLRRDATA